MSYQIRAGAGLSTKTRPGHSGHPGVSAIPMRAAGPLFSYERGAGSELQAVPAGARRRAEWGTRDGRQPGVGGEGTPALAVAAATTLRPAGRP